MRWKIFSEQIFYSKVFFEKLKEKVILFRNFTLKRLGEFLMITIEQLEEFGVDTKEGLTRCMNNQNFYFKMLKMGLNNDQFEKLESALAANNIEDAFEAAHALKGVLGNLALTPIYKPLAEMTEMLRSKKTADYVEMYKPILELRDKLVKLM